MITLAAAAFGERRVVVLGASSAQRSSLAAGNA